jgi:hypothetical protein
MGGVTAPTSLRFRQNGAFLVAVMIAFVGTLPLAGVNGAYAPVILIPLAIGGWAWRSGTDIDADGLRVRALLGSRRIGWPRVREIAADPKGRVFALLTDGHAIRLAAVRATDLPLILKTRQSPADGGPAQDEPAQ